MAVDQQTYQPDQQLNLLGAEDIVAPEELVPGRGAVPTEPLRVGVGGQPETGEFQVAGGKGSFLVDLLKAVGVTRRGDSAPGIGDLVQATRRGDVPMPPTLLGEQLPAPTTAEGKPITYRQQRDAAAAELFSTGGYARWKSEREAKRQVQEQKMHDPQGVMETARQALSYEQGALGGRVAPRALDEETAEEFIEQLASPEERAVHLVEQDDFNLDQMTSGDDVKAVIAVMGERLKDPVEQAKRGVQTHEMTKERAAELLADETGFTKRILRRRVGELYNAEEQTALRVLLQKAISELDELATKVATGQASPEDMIRLRRKMAITAGIYQAAKGSQTEIARAANAFRIPVGLEPGDLRGELIMDMLEQSGGADLTVKLAKGYLTAKEQGGNAAAHEYSNRGWAARSKDVFLEAHINGLLSWVKSDMKNIGGNANFMIWQIPEDMLAGLIGAGERTLLRAIGRGADIEEGMFMGSVIARTYGNLSAMKEAFILAGNAFRSNAIPDTASKVEMSQFKAIDAERLGITNQPIAKTVDILGTTVRLPTTMLSSEDTWFKAISQRGELYALAYEKARIAHLNGETQEEAIDRMIEVLVDPRSVGKQLDDAARYNTMTTDLGAIGEVTRVIQRSLLGRMVVPFSTAPTNTLLRAAERHPGMLLINQDFWKGLQGKLGPRARQKATARLMMGAAATYAIYDLALQGRVTGPYPRTQRERDMLPQGWQPYAFVFRGDDFPVDEDGDPLPLFDNDGVPNGPLDYWNYAGIEPIGAFIGLTAAATQRFELSKDPAVRDNIWAATLAAGSDYVEQGMPFIQGVSAVIKTLMYDDIRHLTDATTGAMIGVAPFAYSSAVKNVSTLFFDDGYKRRTAGAPLNYYTMNDLPKLPNGEPNMDMLGLAKPAMGMGTMDLATEILQQQILRLPFLRDGSTAVVDFDVLGQPIEHVRFDISPGKATWNAVMPIRWTNSEAVPEYFRELVKLGMPIKNPTDSFQGVQLNNELRSNLIYLAKNEIMRPLPIWSGRSPRMYTYRQALEEVLTGPTRMKFEREFPLLKDKQSRLKRIEEAYFEQAMKILTQITPEVGQPGFEGEPIEENVDLRRVVQQREAQKTSEKLIRKRAR